MSAPTFRSHFPSLPIILGTVLLLLPPGCSLLESESESPEPVYPMYVDANGNGRYDHWEAGGRGHGGPHAGSGRMGGMNAADR